MLQNLREWGPSPSALGLVGATFPHTSLKANTRASVSAAISSLVTAELPSFPPLHRGVGAHCGSYRPVKISSLLEKNVDANGLYSPFCFGAIPCGKGERSPLEKLPHHRQMLWIAWNKLATSSVPVSQKSSTGWRGHTRTCSGTIGFLFMTAKDSSVLRNTTETLINLNDVSSLLKCGSSPLFLVCQEVGCGCLF